MEHPRRPPAPAPSLGVVGLIAGLEATWASLGRLARRLRASEWGLATACPGWDVADQLAHIVGFEAALAGRGQPVHQLPGDLPHVTDDFRRWVECQIDVRRGRPPGALRDELADVAAARSSQLRAAAASGDDTAVTAAMESTQPLARMLPVRLADVWIHEQDIRRATGRCGHVTGPVPRQVLAQMLNAVAKAMATRRVLDEGVRVGLVITGPTPANAGIEVTDGRGRISAHDPGAASATLTCSFDTFIALAAGRIAPSCALARVDGDEALGRRILAHLTVTP